jgi:TetR/AcrR family transcriptional regulator
MLLVYTFGLTIWLNCMVDEANKDETTEQKILAAAKEVFLEQGMSGARMQDIADRAGINKALLHYYFRSKDKLFEVVYNEAAAQFLPRVGVLFQMEMPLFEKIEKFVSTYIDLLIENPYIPMFVLNEMHKDPNFPVTKIWGNGPPPVHLLLKQIETEMQNGHIKPIQPMQLMLNMVSMCIFPFIARPMVKLVFGVNDKQFMAAMQERKQSIPKFIIDSIRQ